VSEQNKAVVRRLVEDHWNAKNAALVEELFTPAVSLHTPDGELPGLEGASLLLQVYMTAFPDFHIAIHDLIAEQALVAVRYTFTGTQLGPLGELPATAKSVTVSDGTFMFRLAEGKISEGHLMWNKYSLLQQLGAVVSGTPAGA
jgi:steroid delta-isomerase-like uncharacterized protein